ncbi:ATP synthase beta subunit C-terminal domain-containing protein [Thalassobacillus hwangdonensis]|uniref:ATP synthase A/B type C-terminal domain-containing protein n=1 Tax=Thalassobacillus hwangdonensis TaxID=546108 RepID=A0ABW3L172_9BACI
MENISLNVALLRRKVPNLTSAAKSVGLRPATVSNLCTGKIPVGRSEVRTIVALASLADCSLDELIIRGGKVEMIETGIKTLDVFAPLTKGGTVGLVARPGMGQLVIIAEVFYRLRKDGYKTMMLKPEGEHPEVDDLKEQFDVMDTDIEKVYEQIKANEQAKGIVFAADRSEVVNGEIFALQERLQKEGITSVTTFLLDLSGDSMDEELPYGPLETLWQFDIDLAARHMYPAVTPVSSTSTLLEDVYIDQTHFTVQQRARKLLRRYRELRSFVNVKGEASIPDSERQTYVRGERLEAYLTQPFFVAEEFTKQKGEFVHLKDALSDIQKIVDGATDTVKKDELHFIGKIQ